MTLTIELAPEVETALNEAAAREGQDPAAFARAAVEEELSRLNGDASTPGRRATLEEFEAAMDEMADLGAHLPPPDPSETYSRATIYADHD